MKDIILFIDDDKSIDANRGLPLALSYLNTAKLGYTSVRIPMLVYDANLYARVKTVIIRNVNTPQSIGIFRQLKEHANRFGFSIAYYYDGLFIHTEEGEVLPDYIRDNTPTLTSAHIDTAIKIMKHCDYIIVKNDVVARHLKRDAGIQTPIQIFGDYVPKYTFQSKESKISKINIFKVRMAYIASTDDYSSIGKQKSGFTDEFLKWMKDRLAYDRWHLYVIYPKGHFPWFMEDFRRYNECYMIEADGIGDLHRHIRLHRPHFALQPTDDTAFNRMNSDGRILECYAAMLPVITTQHDVTANRSNKDYVQIKVKEFTSELVHQRILVMMPRESYNAVIESQYEYLDQNNLWLEDNLPRLVGFL